MEDSESDSLEDLLASPSQKRRRPASTEDGDLKKQRLRQRADSPGSDDDGGPALHVPYLQEPARAAVGAEERKEIRKEMKDFLQVCKLAKTGDLFPLEEVIREAEKTRTREHYLSCLAQDQSAVLQAAVRRPAILHAFRDWLEAFLMESASPDALHTIIQVLAKLPMTIGMLKVSGLLPMLQQAVKELQEHSPAREPAVRTLQKWRALLRHPSATSHQQPLASPVDVASGGQSSSALPYSGQQSGSLLPQPQSTSHADALDVKVERQRQAAEAAMQLAQQIAAKNLPQAPVENPEVESFEEFMQHGSGKVSRRKSLSEAKRSGAVRRPRETPVPSNKNVVEAVHQEVRRFITAYFVNLYKAGKLTKETAKALVEKTAGKILNQPDYTEASRAKVTSERKAKIQQLMEKEVAKAMR
ncbi:hypothetical protein WJX84_006954 [Apatococcus fuscideae]|uniref:TFIIS N-terminal domain-containing protein n=1 Tax=Apatococcus fuscideae TaxID=2026836 RepID=A0AAW1S4V5_9CHLO